MITDNTNLIEVDGGWVKLLEVQGDETLIALAARQSYGSEKYSNVQSLMSYLMAHGHGVPFEYVSLVFKLNAPFFIARHFYTYRTWTRSEKSLRYTQIKGSGAHYPDLDYLNETQDDEATEMLYEFYKHSAITYEKLRKLGVRKEDARCVIPMGMHTEFMVKIDLRNFQHFLEQRLAKDTQPATRKIAYAMYELSVQSLPIWGKVFTDQHLDLLGMT